MNAQNLRFRNNSSNFHAQTIICYGKPTTLHGKTKILHMKIESKIQIQKKKRMIKIYGSSFARHAQKYYA